MEIKTIKVGDGWKWMVDGGKWSSFGSYPSEEAARKDAQKWVNQRKAAAPTPLEETPPVGELPEEAPPKDTDITTE